MTGGAAYILCQEAISDVNKRIDNLPKAFVPQGTIKFSELPTTLSESNLGYIWNIKDDFTTDDRFIEGAGKKYPAGNNVAVIKHESRYYFDVMSVIDLSNYYTKVEVNTLISTEQDARSQADTTLQNNITDEINNRISAINAVNESINQESITREQADTTLTTNLNSEITRAKSEEAKKVDKEIVGANGNALIFNESDGGGAKFEHTDGTWSFTGVNDGGASGIAAQIYAIDHNNGNKGSKLDITKNGIYYTTGDTSGLTPTQRDVEANEIATKELISTEADLRRDADSVLTTNLDSEVTRANLAESTISGNLDTEITNRTNADTTLQTNIDSNRTLIVQEAIDRNNADAKLTLEKQDKITDLETIRDGAAKGATALQEHQDISGKLNKLPNVDDPTDPGYGFPYWIPYSFATTTKTDGLDIILKTLTLDNQLLKHEFTNAFPVVSETQAGIMTAADKIALIGKQDQLTAGTNVQIVNNIISATDTKYTVTVDL